MTAPKNRGECESEGWISTDPTTNAREHMMATKSYLHFGHWFQGIQGLGDNRI